MLVTTKTWLAPVVTNETRAELRLQLELSNNSQLLTYIEPIWASLSLITSTSYHSRYFHTQSGRLAADCVCLAINISEK